MADPTLTDLLQHGYFPKELPPTFTTEGFGSTALAHSARLDGAFNTCKTANVCRYHFARPGTLRRVLGVPNPIHQFQIAKEISSHWTEITQSIERSTLSISAPVGAATSGRAVEPRISRKQILDQRLQYRASSRFMLQADISQFYPTIYTHTIPWALHGRDVAKARRRDLGLIGNRLDRCLQALQDGQTKGIPVGPDTSFVIAELLLASCDVRLQQDVGSLRGFRYYDDYELYFDTRAQAEAALPKLEAVLGSHELTLNPAKSKVDTVLQPVDFPWARIRRVEVRSSDTARQRNDLIFLFEEAFELARLRNTDHVLKYAVGRLEDVEIHEDNLGLYARLLCQSVMIEHAVLPLVLNQLISRREQGQLTFDEAVGSDLLKAVLNRHILVHAPLGNSSEVAWALWGALAFRTPLEVDATTVVCSMRDSVVALMALAAHQDGLLNAASVDQTWWRSQATSEALLGEHWLLAYEAVAQGWLPRVLPPAPPSREAQAALDLFEFLQDNGVRFYSPEYGHNDALSHVEEYGDATADEPDEEDEEDEGDDRGDTIDFSRLNEEDLPF